MKIFFLTIFLVLSLRAQAQEQVICTIKSDIDANYALIIADVDSESTRLKHLYQDTFEGTKLIKRIEIKESELAQGVVLDSEGRYVTVLIRSEHFDFGYGGTLVLDTLYSGVSGKRKSYQMDMSFDQGRPRLVGQDGPFSHIYFIANRSVLFGVIGIEKLIFQE